MDEGLPHMLQGRKNVHRTSCGSASPAVQWVRGGLWMWLNLTAPEPHLWGLGNKVGAMRAVQMTHLHLREHWGSSIAAPHCGAQQCPTII